MRSVKLEKGLIKVKEVNFYSITSLEKNKFKMSYENKANNPLFTEQKSRCFCCNWPFQLSGSGELVNLVTINTGGKLLLCDDCFNQIESLE